MQAVEAGRLEGDPMLVSVFLWVTCHGLTSLFISKPNFPWPDRDRLTDRTFGRAWRDGEGLTSMGHNDPAG